MRHERYRMDDNEKDYSVMTETEKRLQACYPCNECLYFKHCEKSDIACKLFFYWVKGERHFHQIRSLQSKPRNPDTYWFEKMRNDEDVYVDIQLKMF